MTRTVVVGLDGAGLALLRPWIAAGELPTLRHILESGVSGTLRSVLPPVTSPNWKAYATGKNPGKLGVFWWQNVDVDGRRIYRPTERYHEHTEFWELLARDERVGVMGVPTTYPPKSVGEFLVAGAPDARERGYAYPAEVERQLRERHDYHVVPRYSLSEEPERAREELLSMIDTRFEAGRALAAEHDLEFLQLSVFWINQLHHHLWDHDCTLRAWQRIDDHLQSFLEAGDNLVLMSDHGHAEIETVFRINAWLQREGYLSWDARVPDLLYRAGLDTGSLKDVLRRADRRLPGVELRSLAGRLAPEWVVRHLPNAHGAVDGRNGANVDWSATDVVASAQGPVYLTVPESSDRYEPLRSELAEKLESLTGPDGRPVVEAVHRAEDVYEGPYLSEGPDLVIEKADHVNVREWFGPAPVFESSDDVWRGVNTPKGLFAATGPDFGTGGVGDVSILDLAPTLLHLHGHAVPADMDGTVRTGVFAPGSEASRRAVQSGSSAAGAD